MYDSDRGPLVLTKDRGPQKNLRPKRKREDFVTIFVGTFYTIFKSISIIIPRQAMSSFLFQSRYCNLIQRSFTF